MDVLILHGERSFRIPLQANKTYKMQQIRKAIEKRLGTPDLRIVDDATGRGVEPAEVVGAGRVLRCHDAATGAPLWRDAVPHKVVGANAEVFDRADGGAKLLGTLAPGEFAWVAKAPAPAVWRRVVC